MNTGEKLLGSNINHWKDIPGAGQVAMLRNAAIRSDYKTGIVPKYLKSTQTSDVV